MLNFLPGVTQEGPMSLDPDVAYWAEMSEALAFADIFRATAGLPDDPLGAIVSEPGDGAAFAFTKIDISLFNRAIGIGVARPAVASDVDDVVAFFDGAERAVSVVQLAPHAAPPEAIGWFEARGYNRGRTWVKMWHDLASIPEGTTDLRIERVGREGADDVGRIGAEAFELPPILAQAFGAAAGMPRWTHYLGFDGETPVSSAGLWIRDGVAWLGGGATLPSHRGRGGQSAMFAERLRDARDAGCRFAITETGEETAEEPNPSYRNMVRAGFQLAYGRRNWIRQRPTAPAT
jgi:GNAT superfamily N-acetyltransferase